jgi:hypothetical protein
MDPGKVRDAADTPAVPTQSDDSGLSRRKALGRMVAYTAPVMLALLVSEECAAVSAE